MNDMRLFKAAMALTLAALAGVVARHNLLTDTSDAIPTMHLRAGQETEPVAWERIGGPDPTLPPGTVVQVQLEALRQSGGNPRAMRLVYSFASPSNRRQTGSLETFTTIMRSPPYRPMLSFRHVRYGPVILRHQTAQQQVLLTTPEGRQVGFVFLLALQQDGPARDCWMTEGVIRLTPPGDGEREADEDADDKVRI